MDKLKSRFSTRYGTNQRSGFGSRIGGGSGSGGAINGGSPISDLNNRIWIDETDNIMTDESNNILIFIK